MALPAPATVPARVLGWLVSAEGLGELHVTLAPAARWRAPTARDPVPAQAEEALTALGWRSPAGGVEREVAAALAVLCRPSVEMFGWITHLGRTIGVLTARIGKEALIAVRTPDGMVGLAPIPPARLAERLVAQTPHVGGGTGGDPAAAISVSPKEVRTVNSQGRVRGQATVGPASAAARRARRLLDEPRTGGGELWVASRDDLGTRRLAGQPVRYVDLAGGRRIIRVRGDRVEITPVSRDQLAGVLLGRL